MTDIASAAAARARDKASPPPSETSLPTVSTPQTTRAPPGGFKRVANLTPPTGGKARSKTDGGDPNVPAPLANSGEEKDEGSTPEIEKEEPEKEAISVAARSSVSAKKIPMSSGNVSSAQLAQILRGGVVPPSPTVTSTAPFTNGGPPPPGPLSSSLPLYPFAFPPIPPPPGNPSGELPQISPRPLSLKEPLTVPLPHKDVVVEKYVTTLVTRGKGEEEKEYRRSRWCKLKKEGRGTFSNRCRKMFLQRHLIQTLFSNGNSC